MGISVDENACNRCGTADEPMCVRDCPGDLTVSYTHLTLPTILRV